MAPSLSGGVLKTIICSSNNEDLPESPILQVLSTKKLAPGQSSQDRYRIAVSDGEFYYTAAMLATQMNDMVQPGKVEAKAIIRLDKYTCNVIQATRKVLIILEAEVLTPAQDVESKIGDPQVLTYEPGMEVSNGPSTMNRTDGAPPKPASYTSSNQSKENFGGQQQKPFGGPVNNSYGTSNGRPNMTSSFGAASGDKAGGKMNVHPISSLTPYQNRWVIQARVTNKSSIRTWSNSRGEGRLFNVDLIDKSGEIKATGFNEAVDKFYNLFELNKVYYISKASLKTANKQYTSIKNDYEMYLNSDTVVEVCEEKVDLPSVQFSFVGISTLEDIPKDTMVDIIGVVKSSSDLSQITTRATNKQVFKRDLFLVDRSGKSVQVTLWGTDAENFEQHVDKKPIMAIKGARVSDFGGRSLTVMNSSVMQINPDIADAHGLRGWFDEVGQHTDAQSISGQRMEGGGGGGQLKSWMQVDDEGLGMGDKADYFTLRGACIHFKQENCLYKACPSPDCNKKVIEDGDTYRCEKCNRTYPDFKYRMILQTDVGDFSGSKRVTFFQESGEAVLGVSAEKLGQLRDEENPAFDKTFSSAIFQLFNFKIRAKTETYNDETRLKLSCVSATTINYKEDARRLLDLIKRNE